MFDVYVLRQFFADVLLVTTDPDAKGSVEPDPFKDRDPRAQ